MMRLIIALLRDETGSRVQNPIHDWIQLVSLLGVNMSLNHNVCLCTTASSSLTLLGRGRGKGRGGVQIYVSKCRDNDLEKKTVFRIVFQNTAFRNSTCIYRKAFMTKMQIFTLTIILSS